MRRQLSQYPKLYLEPDVSTGLDPTADFCPAFDCTDCGGAPWRGTRGEWPLLEHGGAPSQSDGTLPDAQRSGNGGGKDTGGGSGTGGSAHGSTSLRAQRRKKTEYVANVPTGVMEQVAADYFRQFAADYFHLLLPA